MNDKELDRWVLVEREDGNFNLRRYVKGKLNESYPGVSRGQASVYLSAVIQGFQPPRGLLRLDRPSD